MKTVLVLLAVEASVAMAWSVPLEASEITPHGVATNRRVIDLNGTWQVAEGAMDSIPQRFEHTVPVPGLIDMAEPAFAEVGKESERRQAFWYRRTFTIEGQTPAVVTLKIHKARYGTKVLLNGRLVGEHLPCFTPALMDVKEYLKGPGQENELIVRIGADRGCLPAGQPTGWDFEKYLYIPGIYDSVELILSGEPRIVSIQAVPEIDCNSAMTRTFSHVRSAGGQERFGSGESSAVECPGGRRRCDQGGRCGSLEVMPAVDAGRSVPVRVEVRYGWRHG